MSLSGGYLGCFLWIIELGLYPKTDTRSYDYLISTVVPLLVANAQIETILVKLIWGPKSYLAIIF
jgi:hypothetical protein